MIQVYLQTNVSVVPAVIFSVWHATVLIASPAPMDTSLMLVVALAAPTTSALVQSVHQWPLAPSARMDITLIRQHLASVAALSLAAWLVPIPLTAPSVLVATTSMVDLAVPARVVALPVNLLQIAPYAHPQPISREQLASPARTY